MKLNNDLRDFIDTVSDMDGENILLLAVSVDTVDLDWLRTQLVNIIEGEIEDYLHNKQIEGVEPATEWSYFPND